MLIASTILVFININITLKYISEAIRKPALEETLTEYVHLTHFISVNSRI